MSIKWMYSDLTRAKLDGSAVLLVLDLALHTDDAGVCHTSVEALAHYCGLGQRKVRRLLGTLHQRGYITVTDRGDLVLAVRVNCMHMLLGNPSVDGTPVVAEETVNIESPLPHLSAPHIAPNWN